MKLTFFYEADCFNLNQLEANIDLNWGWYISIWTNWRLTFFLWGWQFQSEADTFQSGANWWLTFSEADTFNLYQLEADNFYEDDCFNLDQLRGWQSFCEADHSSLRHLWRLTWGWQLFLEADMFQSGGWHGAGMSQSEGWQLFFEADHFYLNQLGGWQFFSKADHFNLNQLEADNYFLRLTWGWHEAGMFQSGGWHSCFEADTFHFEPTGGWQLFFEADTSQSEPTLGLTILFSKSEPFQSGSSKRLSILTAQFGLSWFFSSLNLTISVFSFLDHFVFEPVAICLNLNTGCFPPDCLKLAWF